MDFQVAHLRAVDAVAPGFLVRVDADDLTVPAKRNICRRCLNHQLGGQEEQEGQHEEQVEVCAQVPPRPTHQEDSS